jgi:Immunoglobulin-like domain of bacterial spore germination
VRRHLPIIAVLFLAACGAKTSDTIVSDFRSCASAGFPIMESFPRQCRGPDGTTYRESPRDTDGDAVDIHVTSLLPDGIISGTASIFGKARGTWFFEGSFPIVVKNADGDVVAQGIATAQGDWMTEEFVPFEATIEIPPSASGNGTVVFMKDNPSGLPENDASMRIPVVFGPPGE